MRRSEGALYWERIVAEDRRNVLREVAATTRLITIVFLNVFSFLFLFYLTFLTTCTREKERDDQDKRPKRLP